MSDLISRQAAIDALNEVSKHYTNKGREWHPHINFMVDAIVDLPSAERHGRWTKVGYIENTWLISACSVCGKQTIDAGCYCPNCGASMTNEVKK